MKIVGVHLYNDLSGSPMVFSHLIKHWVEQGNEVHLITSQHNGRLSNISGVHYHIFRYQWSPNRYKTLFRFFKVNITIFFITWRLLSSAQLVYINTWLPFGAALAAKIRKKTCIYHSHETTVRPLLFKRFLKRIVKLTADKIIYVSKYLKNTEGFNQPNEHVVYNALSDEFFNKAATWKNNNQKGKNHILMLASFRAYKGIEEFTTLAEKLPDFTFELVLNTTDEERNSFLEQNLPKNLIISPSSKDVHIFYRRAALLLNLSRPDQWVETFGLTLIEAMAYGIPVISPPVGGPTEIVTKDVGYQISCYDMEKLVTHVEVIMTDKILYQQLSQGAFSQAKKYRMKNFLSQVDSIILNKI